MWPPRWSRRWLIFDVTKTPAGFFRHAYTAELDPRRLAELRDHALAARAHLDEDLDTLDEMLGKLADAAAT